MPEEKGFSTRNHELRCSVPKLDSCVRDKGPSLSRLEELLGTKKGGTLST